MQGRGLKKALQRWKGMDRKSVKKIKVFLCSVSLEILEVTSLSARLLRRTSENVFQGKDMRPYTTLHYWGGGFYINLRLANPVRFPDGIPGDLAVSNTSRKTYTNRIWLFSRTCSVGSICLNRVLSQKLGLKVGNWSGGCQWTLPHGHKLHIPIGIYFYLFF